MMSYENGAEMSDRIAQVDKPVIKHWRVVKVHLYDEKKESSVHCGTYGVDPLFTTAIEKVTCLNCKRKINQPRYTKSTKRKKIKSWILQSPSFDEVERASKVGKEIEMKLKQMSADEASRLNPW